MIKQVNGRLALFFFAYPLQFQLNIERYHRRPAPSSHQDLYELTPLLTLILGMALISVCRI